MAPTRLSAKAKLREALDEFALASDETKKPELRLADVATDKDAGREQLVVLFTPPKDKGTAQPPPTAHDKRDQAGVRSSRSQRLSLRILGSPMWQHDQAPRWHLLRRQGRESYAGISRVILQRQAPAQPR